MPTQRGKRSAPSAAARNTAEELHAAVLQLLHGLGRNDSVTGLTTRRLSALTAIVVAGPLMLHELASIEQVRPPTMTRMVDVLEDHGLVSRRRDPKDRRRTHIVATARGRAVLDRGRVRRTQALAGELATLSSADLATLRRAAEIMTSLSSNLI